MKLKYIHKIITLSITLITSYLTACRSKISREKLNFSGALPFFQISSNSVRIWSPSPVFAVVLNCRNFANLNVGLNRNIRIFAKRKWSKFYNHRFSPCYVINSNSCNAYLTQFQSSRITGEKWWIKWDIKPCCHHNKLCETGF